MNMTSCRKGEGKSFSSFKFKIKICQIILHYQKSEEDSGEGSVVEDNRSRKMKDKNTSHSAESYIWFGNKK